MKTVLQIPTPSLKKSIDFYKSLGFEIETIGNYTYASSKNLCIELSANTKNRIGIQFICDHLPSLIEESKLESASIKTEDGYLAVSPIGCCVYLRNKRNLPNLKDKDSNLGSFSGLSLEVMSIEAEISFWSKFGFKQTSGNISQGWVNLTNSVNFSIGIMKFGLCPHLFFKPSLSFFNGKKNLTIIENLRKKKIKIEEEITTFNKEGIVDNIIIKDENGFGFFVFSD